MSVRVNRIFVDYDLIQKHNQVSYAHNDDVELVDLVTSFQAPDRLLDIRETETPIFNRTGDATIVRPVGPFGIYYLYVRPNFALSSIVVEPDDVFVDVTRVKDQLVYCFYNGTRRESISITATICEDLEGVARELSSDLNDATWRQYFVRKILKKPAARPIGQPTGVYPDIMTAAQAARYLSVEEKTIRNWTSEGKIPFKKLGSSVRYKKSELDQGLEKGAIGKSSSKKPRARPTHR
jgi:excisionase family DNA binding protein